MRGYGSIVAMALVALCMLNHNPLARTIYAISALVCAFFTGASFQIVRDTNAIKRGRK